MTLFVVLVRDHREGGGGGLCSRLNRVSLEKLMVQVVPTGYDYIGGSRDCLKERGGAAYHDYFCPPFGPKRRDYSTKNNSFLVKFSDLGVVASIVYVAWLDYWHVRRTKIKVGPLNKLKHC